jgi:hypothetical protein
MKIILNDTPFKTLEEVRQFLNGVGAIEFRIEVKEARYAWMQAMVFRFHYPSCVKPRRGSYRAFFRKSAAIPGFKSSG